MKKKGDDPALTCSAPGETMEACAALKPKSLSTVDAGPGVLLPVPSEVEGFDLLDKIGAGSSATVYRGWDRELRRIVAIKFPRFRGLNDAAQDRFLREARTVARLRHPNILPVYDVKRHGGQACIVSHFVDGQNLRDWMKESGGDLRAGVDVAVQILRALTHAHDTEIIHRDLKPENVMIDESGHVYVTDFGLAAPPTNNTDVSDQEQASDLEIAIVGTPGYMSPEQAAGKNSFISSKSDIYSFGVILFELLTGRRPFEDDDEQLLKRIQAEKPPAARTFNAGVDRDLNAIVARCIQPNAPDRFDSAQEISDELLRWQLKEPVRCRPASTLSRMIRWSYRNPMTAGLLSTILVLLVVSTLVSLQLTYTAQREAKAATEFALGEQQQRERAESRLLTSLDAVDSITDHIVGDVIQNIPGMEETQLDLLRHASELYESLLHTDPDDLRVHAAKAQVHCRIGLAERMRGRFTNAEHEFDKALFHCERIKTREHFKAVVAECIRAKSMFKKRTGDVAGAIAEIARAIQITNSFPSTSPAGTMTETLQRQRRTRALCLSSSGSILRQADSECAERHLLEAIGILELLGPDNERCDDMLINVVRTHKTLASLYGDRRNSDLARQHIAAALDALRSISLIEREQNWYRELSSLLFHSAFTYRDLGNLAAAKEQQLRSIEIREQLTTESPCVVDYPEGIARSYAFLGDLEKKSGRLQEALKFHRRALVMRRDVANKFGPRSVDHVQIARSLRSLALVHQALDELELAEEHFLKAIEHWELVADAGPEKAKIQAAVYNIRRNLGFVCDKLQHHADADGHLLAAFRIAENLSSRFPDNVEYREGLERIQQILQGRELKNSAPVQFAQPDFQPPSVSGTQ